MLADTTSKPKAWTEKKREDIRKKESRRKGHKREVHSLARIVL